MKLLLALSFMWSRCFVSLQLISDEMNPGGGGGSAVDQDFLFGPSCSSAPRFHWLAEPRWRGKES